MDRDVFSFFAVGAGKAANMITALVTTFLIGSHAGPDELGRWMLLVAAAVMLHTLLISWTYPSGLRFGCEEWQREHSICRTVGARAPLVAAGALAAVIVLVADPGGLLAGVFGAGADEIPIVGLYFLSVWMAGESQLLLQATNRLTMQAALGAAAGAVALVAVVTLGVQRALTAEAALLVTSIASLVIWVPAWVRTMTVSGVRWGRGDGGGTVQHLRFALPLLLSLTIGYVSDWGDHLLLRLFVSVAAVGAFGFAYQVLTLFIALNGLFPTVILPRLVARNLSRADTATVYIERVVPTIFTIWVLGTVWVVAFVPLLVGLLGSDFSNAMTTTLLLCAVVPASAVTSLYTVLFSLQQRTSRTFAYVAAMTAVNLSISVLLVPRYGLVGAAIGTCASYLVAQAAYAWDQHRVVGAHGTRVWTIWAAAVGAGLCQVALGAPMPLRILWAVAATAAIMFVARRTAAVDSSVLTRILSGPFAPFAPALARALVSPRVVS